MLEKFRKLLEYHQARVAHLLKKYKVKEPVSAEVIQKAFELHGQKFLMDFIEIIKSTPGTYSHNGFISTYQPFDSPDDVVDPPAGGDPGGAGGDKSNIWDFLGNILNVGYDIYDSTRKKPYYPGGQGYDPNRPYNQYYGQQLPKSNTLTYVIIAGVIILVLAFIFKK